MIIDKEGKLFGIINILDLLIILVLICGIYIGYNKLFVGPGSMVLNDKVEYKVEFTLKTEDFVNTIETGDKIWDSVKGNYLGQVIDVEKYPSAMVTENLEKGIFEESRVPQSFDCTLTIKANGNVTDNNILAEGIPIRVGERVFLKGKGYASQGFIIGIKY